MARFGYIVVSGVAMPKKIRSSVLYLDSARHILESDRKLRDCSGERSNDNQFVSGVRSRDGHVGNALL